MTQPDPLGFEHAGEWYHYPLFLGQKSDVRTLRLDGKGHITHTAGVLRAVVIPPVGMTIANQKALYNGLRGRVQNQINQILH
jgi:hypothetical protein